MPPKRSWASLAMVTPLWLASCDKTKESGESRSQPGNHTDVGLFDSVGLGDGRGRDSGGIDIAEFGTCSESTALFAGCEAPVAQPSDDPRSSNAACPVEPRLGLTVARNEAPHTSQPTTHAAPGADSLVTPMPQLPALTERCGQEEAAARVGTMDHLIRSAGESACACGMKKCGCA